MPLPTIKEYCERVTHFEVEYNCYPIYDHIENVQKEGVITSVGNTWPLDLQEEQGLKWLALDRCLRNKATLAFQRQLPSQQHVFDFCKELIYLLDDRAETLQDLIWFVDNFIATYESFYQLQIIWGPDSEEKRKYYADKDSLAQALDISGLFGLSKIGFSDDTIKFFKESIEKLHGLAKGLIFNGFVILADVLTDAYAISQLSGDSQKAMVAMKAMKYLFQASLAIQFRFLGDIGNFLKNGLNFGENRQNCGQADGEQNKFDPKLSEKLLTSLAGYFVNIFTADGNDGLLEKVRVNKITQTARVIKSCENLYDVFLRIWKFAMEMIQYYFGAYLPDFLQPEAAHHALKEWITSTDKFVAIKVNLEITKKSLKLEENRNDLLTAYYEGHQLMRLIDKKSSFFYSIFKHRMDIITNLVEGCGVSLFNQGMRVCPEAIMIVGEPGIGKSTFVDALLAAVFDLIGLPKFKKERDIFQKPPTSDFWEGYCYQPCLLIDDIFQVKDNDVRYQTIADIIALCHDVPCPLNFAHLDSKGAKFFHSDFVIMTSNKELNQHTLAPYMESPKAFDRRISLFIQPEPPANVLTRGKIDRVKAAAANLKFSDFNFLVRKNSTDQPENKTFIEVVEIIAENYISRREEKKKQDEIPLYDEQAVDGLKNKLNVKDRLSRCVAEGLWEATRRVFNQNTLHGRVKGGCMLDRLNQVTYISERDKTVTLDKLERSWKGLSTKTQQNLLVKSYFQVRKFLASFGMANRSKEALENLFQTDEFFELLVEVLRDYQTDKICHIPPENVEDWEKSGCSQSVENYGTRVCTTCDFYLCVCDFPLGKIEETEEEEVYEDATLTDDVVRDRYVQPTTWVELFKAFMDTPKSITLLFEVLTAIGMAFGIKSFQIVQLVASLLPIQTQIVPFLDNSLSLFGVKTTVLLLTRSAIWAGNKLIEQYRLRTGVVNGNARIETKFWTEKENQCFDSHLHESQKESHAHVCFICDRIFVHTHSLEPVGPIHSVCDSCFKQINDQDKSLVQRLTAQSMVMRESREWSSPKKKLTVVTRRFKARAEAEQFELDTELTIDNMKCIFECRKLLGVKTKHSFEVKNIAESAGFEDKDVDSYFHSTTMDPMVIDMVGTIVNNIGTLRCITSGFSTSCLRVKGHLVIFPYHLIQTNSDDKFQFKFDSPTINNVLFTRKGDEILSYPENDIAIMKLPRDLTLARDITKYFIPVDSLKSFYPYGIMTRMMPMTGGRITDNSILENITADKEPLLYNVAGNEDLQCIKSYGYKGLTRDGDCGAPVVVVDPTSPRKILGFHVAKSGGSILRGHCNVLTMDMIVELIETFEEGGEGKEIPAVVSVEGSYSDPKCIGDTSSEDQVADFYGFSEDGIYGVSKTQIVPSIVQGVFPVTTKPTMLKPGKVNGEWWDPKIVSSGRGHKVEKYYNDPEILDLAVRAVVEKNNNFECPDYIEKRILTDSEVVNGVIQPGTEANYPYLARMELNTSLGYPLGSMFPGYKKKDLFLTGPNGERVMNAVLEKMFKKSEEVLLNGECELMLCIETLKDERKQLHKAHKSRVFSVPAIHHVMLTRKYTLMYCAYLMTNHVCGEVAAGINVHSNSWGYLKKRLEIFTKLIAGDYIHWDKSLVYQMAIRFAEVMNRWYGQEEPNFNRARYILCCSAFSSLRYINGRWCRQTGMPSGTSFTTIGNSIINSIIINCAFFANAKYLGYKMDLAYEIRMSEVEATFYGDDHVIAMSEKAASILDMAKLKEFLVSAIGMNYTDAKKNEVLELYIDWKDVTFLKRTWSEVGSYVYAPLELSIVQEIVNWQQKGMDPVLALEVSTLSFCIELAHHSREVFEENVSILRGACAAKGISIKFLTYTECEEMIRGGLHKDLIYENKQVIETLNEVIQAESHHVILTRRDKYGLPVDVEWCPQKGKMRNESHHKCQDCKQVCLTLMRMSDHSRKCFLCANVFKQEDIPEWYYHEKENCGFCEKMDRMIFQRSPTAYAQMDGSRATEADMNQKSEKPTLFEDVAATEISSNQETQSDFPPMASEELDLKNFFSRPVLLRECTWNDSGLSLSGSHLGTEGDTNLNAHGFSVTELFFKNPVWSDKLKNVAFIRGDIELEIRINATQMSYGCIQVTYVPYARAIMENYMGQISPYSNMVTMSSCPQMQLLNPNQSETLVFNIGWPLNKEFIMVDEFDSEEGARSIDLGGLYFFIIHPLECVSKEPISVSILTYGRFKNPQLGGFTLRDKAISTSELRWSQGFTTFLDKDTGNFWEVCSLSGFTNPRLLYVDTLPTAEGFSTRKPKTKKTPKQSASRKIEMDSFATCGPRDYPKGSLFHEAYLQSMGSPHLIEEIANQYSLVFLKKIGIDKAPIEIVKFPVTPAACIAVKRNDDGIDMWMANDTKVACTGKFYRFQEQVFKIVIVSSTFFSFRVKISWDPLVNSWEPPPTPTDDSVPMDTNIKSEVIDVRSYTEVEFSIPYLRDTPYLVYGAQTDQWNTSNGWLRIRIISAISQPFGDVTPSVTFAIYRKTVGLQIARPCGDHLSFATYGDHRPLQNPWPANKGFAWNPVHTTATAPQPPEPGFIDKLADALLSSVLEGVLSAGFDCVVSNLRPTDGGEGAVPMIRISDFVYTGDIATRLVPGTPRYFISPQVHDAVNDSDDTGMARINAAVSAIPTRFCKITYFGFFDSKFSGPSDQPRLFIDVKDPDKNLYKKIDHQQVVFKFSSRTFNTNGFDYNEISEIYEIDGTQDFPKDLYIDYYFDATLAEQGLQMQWVMGGGDIHPLVPYDNLEPSSARLAISSLVLFHVSDYQDIPGTGLKFYTKKSNISPNFVVPKSYCEAGSGIVDYVWNSEHQGIGTNPDCWYRITVCVCTAGSGVTQIKLVCGLAGDSYIPPKVVDEFDYPAYQTVKRGYVKRAVYIVKCADWGVQTSVKAFSMALKCTGPKNVIWSCRVSMDMIPQDTKTQSTCFAEMYEDGLVAPEAVTSIYDLTERMGQVGILPSKMTKQILKFDGQPINSWLMDLESTQFTTLMVSDTSAGATYWWNTMPLPQTVPFRRYFLQFYRMVRGSTDILLVPSSNSYHNWQICVVTNNYQGSAIDATHGKNAQNISGCDSKTYAGFPTFIPQIGGSPACSTSGMQFNQATNLSGVSMTIPYNSNVRMIPTTFGHISTRIWKNQVVLMNGDSDVSLSEMDDVAVRVFERTGSDYEYHWHIGAPKTIYYRGAWENNGSWMYIPDVQKT